MYRREDLEQARRFAWDLFVTIGLATGRINVMVWTAALDPRAGKA